MLWYDGLQPLISNIEESERSETLAANATHCVIVAEQHPHNKIVPPLPLIDELNPTLVFETPSDLFCA